MYIQLKNAYNENIIVPKRKGRKNMGVFDRFWRRDELVKKSIAIDGALYEKLDKLSKNDYQTSKNQLINACIEELIRTENVKLYQIQKKPAEQHSLLIRRSLFEGLEYLRDKYDLSIYKLLNIAISNAIEEYENEFSEII